MVVCWSLFGGVHPKGQVSMCEATAASTLPPPTTNKHYTLLNRQPI